MPTQSFLHAIAQAGSGIHEVRGNVRQRTAVRSAVAATAPSVVFHLAAQPLARPSYDEPEATFAISVQGTVSVLEAAREVGGTGAIIVFTSDEWYAAGVDSHP